MTEVGMMKNDNGKRERSNLEEDVEFMPLSKRINNIHLTQNQGGVTNGIHPQQVNGHNGESSHSHHNVDNNGSFENNIYNSEHHQNGHGGHINGHGGHINGHGGHINGHGGHINGHVGHINGHGGHVNGHSHYEGQQHHQADNPSIQDFSSSANTSSLCINNSQQSHQAHHNSNTSSDSTHCQSSVNGVNHQSPNYEHEPLSGAMVSASNNNSSVRYLEDYRYEPVLNENANPHYYEQNRQLFELYMERIHRHNLQPHPHFYNSNSLNDPAAGEHHQQQQHHHQRHNPQT